MEQKLAIIKRVRYGMGDRGAVVLTFHVYVSESEAALQVLGVEQAAEVIRQANVSDVYELEGKPCWVAVKGNLIRFVKLMGV